MALAPGKYLNPKRRRASSRRVVGLRALLPFLRPHLWLVWMGASVLIVTALVSLYLPLVVRRMVDDFSAGNIVLLDRYFAIGLLAVAVLAFGTALRYYLITRLGEHVVVDVRNAVFDHVIDMSPSFYETIMTGEVLSRITADTTLVQSVIGNAFSNALRNILTLGGGLALLLITSVKLAGVVLLVAPFIVLPIYVLGRKMRVLSREAQDWVAASSGKASESLSAVQTVQSFTFEKASKAQFSEFTNASFDAAHRRTKLRAALTFMVYFMAFTSVISVLWVGAQDVNAGRMTAGTLIQFMLYSVMVSSAFAALAQIWSELQRAAGATERLVELLNATDSVHDPEHPKAMPDTVQGKITFDNVQFSYPTRPDVAALKGVSFEIQPGETVALVGPSGAGKTTIIQLIQRFYDPTSGHITLDGHDLRDFARVNFRRALALVPQDPMIFAATATDNIRFGTPDAHADAVVRAAKSAAAHGFITQLPDGYDSYLGERGVMLSGGQKQRIAIARAILRDAPVLLLDEATSALDAQSENAVQSAVDRLSHARTTLIIAHRLATVKKADRIIVLDAGRVIATGTHDELLHAGGLYARLARLQFIG